MQTHRGTAPWKRWLSVKAYGLVTRLYGVDTPPRTARRRFERFATVTRESTKARYPNVSFSDHQAGELWIEALRTSPSPRRVVLHLHGGGFLFGSPATYRSRARRIAFRHDAEVPVPDYRLAPEHPFPLAVSLLAALRDRGSALAAWAFLFSPWTDLGGTGASMIENEGKDVWMTRRHIATWSRYYAGTPDVAAAFVERCAITG
jgi:acetyl esterase/lipase